MPPLPVGAQPSSPADGPKRRLPNANGCWPGWPSSSASTGAELALLNSLDMGKLVTEAYNVDVPSAAELFAFYGEALDKISGEIAPTEPGNLALVSREPLGVVGAVTPWNFPSIWPCGRSHPRWPSATAWC